MSSKRRESEASGPFDLALHGTTFWHYLLVWAEMAFWLASGLHETFAALGSALKARP
jgi:hypothetical protein